MDEKSYFENIAEYKLLAKHEVGQNFLIDSEAAKKIIALADIEAQDKVLEIGSGAGSLSFFIAKEGAQADLIDIDEGLVAKLAEDFREENNLHSLKGNIMRWDVSPYSKIIGNLPYYITSGIIEKILLEAAGCDKAVLMVQKEVVSRFTAKIGSKDYGPLPLLINYRASLVKAFNVPRTSFSPSPHIESSVFVLNFNKNVKIEDAKNLYALASQLFLHRRKTIQNNLISVLQNSDKASSILNKCGISTTKRPEELSLADYLNLVSQLH
jgi:16S rRNA (adenine1518-N6/adenine1519-N6)-dimethyltransferase